MNYHLYADDTQIYASFTYNDPEDMLAAKLGTERSLNDNIWWMSNNKLKLEKGLSILQYWSFLSTVSLHALATSLTFYNPAYVSARLILLRSLNAALLT